MSSCSRRPKTRLQCSAAWQQTRVETSAPRCWDAAMPAVAPPNSGEAQPGHLLACLWRNNHSLIGSSKDESTVSLLPPIKRACASGQDLSAHSSPYYSFFPWLHSGFWPSPPHSNILVREQERNMPAIEIECICTVHGSRIRPRQSWYTRPICVQAGVAGTQGLPL